VPGAPGASHGRLPAITYDAESALGSHDAHHHAWQECLFTGGAFRRPAGGGTIGVRDKASGEIFALAGLATGADVDSAVEAARTAPPGIFGVLPGDVEVGQRLVTHPDVSMIHFTGSTKVGREIAREAGGLLKKVSLELGGNNALIVLDDADIEQATMIGAWSSFHYQGQTCITAGRHIVARKLADAYVEGLAKRADAITVGNTVTGNFGLGPMINAVSSSGRSSCWTSPWPRAP
jgi:acyl-CoA reductase-like NAD-dependent aldehyde dehydrogenase